MILKNVMELVRINNNERLNKKYYILLGFSFMIYGNNEYIDLFANILVLLLFLSNVDRDEFIYSYFAIIFFEAILVIPFIGGSLFRIYQIVFLAKILVENWKLKKGPIQFKFTLSLIALFFFFGSSVLYIESLSGFISSIINALILIYILIKIVKEHSDKPYSDILAVVGYFSCLSGIYGLIYGTGINYGYTMRISGAIGDPNYSSLFYTIGLFSLIGTYSINKVSKITLFSILCVLLVLTVSLSGIFGTFLLLIVYLAIVNLKRAMQLMGSFIAGFFVFLKVKFTYGSTLFGIQFRIYEIINSKDLSFITSGRTNIVSEYLELFRSQSIIKKIFGGTNTISGDYRDLLVKTFKHVSHNSYIDMLFMIGIVGTFVIIILFFLMIKHHIQLYNKTKNLTYLSIAFIKLTLLYYSLSISIFPFRYFYTFLVL